MTPSCPIDRIDFSSVGVREQLGEKETGKAEVPKKKKKKVDEEQEEEEQEQEEQEELPSKQQSDDKHRATYLPTAAAGASGSTISLDKTQVLVKGRAANASFKVQKVLQRHRCLFVGTNHQHLFAAEVFQLDLQPFDPRVLLNPARLRVQCFRMQRMGVVLIKRGRDQ